MTRLGNKQDAPDDSFTLRRKRIAIIGGGVSGAAAARLLTVYGHSVVVLDKGRGAGGRCSTRRNEVMEVDHGAQYFTVADQRFRQVVNEWNQVGVVARWDGRFFEIEAGRVVQTRNRERWVGVPSMSRIVSHLLEGVDIKYDARVDKVVKESDGWYAHTDKGVTCGAFDALIVAMPAPQVRELLAEVSPLLANKARDVVMTSCWAVMAAFDGTVEALYDGAMLRGHDSLAWVARNTSKPGRSHVLPEAWVLHADSEWSRKHVAISREQAGQTLLEAFQSLCKQQNVMLPKLLQVRAHRWRYARTRSPLEVACLTDPELSVAICGDWLWGGKIEAAYLSGLAAAEHMHESMVPI